MNKLTNWRTWLRGLIAAAIGGGANAVTLIVVDPMKFNLNDGGLVNLLLATAVSGFVAAAAYLKQSPIPPPEDSSDQTK